MDRRHFLLATTAATAATVTATTVAATVAATDTGAALTALGAASPSPAAARNAAERWDRLHEIHVKTLTIGARYDEMDPKDMQRMATLMPNATSAYCPNGSHLCMWDDQAVYFHHLLQFLRSV